MAQAVRNEANLNNFKNMTYIEKRTIKGIWLFFLAFVAIGIASCEESRSYSEMLRDEEKAVNDYLAGQKVLLEIPADSISFETGSDAPFYRLDQEGCVYMQVINKGDMNERVKSGDVVYFRFTRKNLISLSSGIDDSGSEDSNSNDFGSGIGNPYFIYENHYLTSSAQWGTGIQMPLEFFGYNCEVNLVLKSIYGFKADQSLCQPYLINLRYFKPEY